jgi:hypothetical protein
VLVVNVSVVVIVWFLLETLLVSRARGVVVFIAEDLQASRCNSSKGRNDSDGGELHLETRG